jgi:Ca2+-binding EF-hand superfamily protein
MRDLRLRIKSDNIDLERLWRKYGFNKQSEMKFADFERFMNYVSPNFTKDEIVYIFQRLDVDKSNSISYKEMEDELKRYNIPMQSAIKVPY